MTYGDPSPVDQLYLDSATLGPRFSDRKSHRPINLRKGRLPRPKRRGRIETAYAG